jgi:hypothetical protein
MTLSQRANAAARTADPQKEYGRILQHMQDVTDMTDEPDVLTLMKTAYHKSERDNNGIAVLPKLIGKPVGTLPAHVLRRDQMNGGWVKPSLPLRCDLLLLGRFSLAAAAAALMHCHPYQLSPLPFPLLSLTAPLLSSIASRAPSCFPRMMPHHAPSRPASHVLAWCAAATQ